MAVVKQSKEKEYINRLFYLPQYAKEIRCTDISNAVFDNFRSCYFDLEKKVKIFGKKVITVEMISYLITSLIFDIFLLLYSTIQLVVYRDFTIGDYTAIINSVWKLYGNVNSIMSFLAKFKLHSEHLNKYMDFINLEPLKTIEGKKITKFESLCLNNVSFSYDDSIETIRNICLEIVAGQKIAIVGYNGAGKTTLIKLMMGLYSVSSGQITYNGVEYSQYSTDNLVRKFRLVSQDNNLYAVSFAENVFMNAYSKELRKEYDMICQKAGLNELLQKHIIEPESSMTSELNEDGIVLSSGEIQLVNVSRIFSYMPADIYILDEPSSALDTMRESSVNKMLMSLDKTVIVITHKLGIAKNADKIYFMENGNIVESGNHSELMAHKGKYYELFNSQKQRIRFSNNNGD